MRAACRATSVEAACSAAGRLPGRTARAAGGRAGAPVLFTLASRRCTRHVGARTRSSTLTFKPVKEATMAVLHPSPPFDDLTYYPISRWIRGTRGKDTIVDSRRALLVWEPGKKVPIYAFPREDVALVSGPAAPSASQARGFADPTLTGTPRSPGIPWITGSR